MTVARRRRLALVVPSLTTGGGVQMVGRFLRDAALRSGNFDLQLVSLAVSARDPMSLRLASPRSWSAGPAVSHGVWEGLPYAHVGAAAGDLEFQRYRPRRVLTRVLADCDVIQVVCGSPAWANAVIGLGKPVAMHVATRAKIERRQRDARPRSLSALWGKAMTPVTDRMDDRALRGVDAIQVMNPWMFEYAKALNTGRDIDVRYLPPGVDTTHFHPGDPRLMPGDPYILCVARLDDPRKRIGLLLQAFALLSDEVRNRTRLVLAGPVPPPDAFWGRADALGVRERISYIERPDERALLKLYQEAAVFGLASDEEGFGMVLLEAMACGIPVISTLSGGPDAIITDGEDGYLVPLGDVSAMALRLCRLLKDQDLNLRMGSQARQTITRRYDARIVGDVFVNIWDGMMRKAGLP